MVSDMRPFFHPMFLRIVAGLKTASRWQRRSKKLDRRHSGISMVTGLGDHVGSCWGILALVLSSIIFPVRFAPAAGISDPMSQIKGYLLYKLERMDAAAHDYVANADAYQAIIDKSAGDYDRAAMEQDREILQLITKMQDDYRAYHNHGYETIEGITAGTKVHSNRSRYSRGRRC
jgi:hypothetical protein